MGKAWTICSVDLVNPQKMDGWVTFCGKKQLKVAGNTEFDDFLLEGVNLGVTSGQDGGA